MNVIWRFYLDGGHRWNWQQIGAGQAVVAESSKGYTNYEACLANAKDRGYVFLPAQSKRAPGRQVMENRYGFGKSVALNFEQAVMRAL